jgi:hypothetical protein
LSRVGTSQATAVSLKRGRENFKELVRECTSSQNVIAKDRVEKFAARTRAYICTYYHLEQVREVPPPVAADAVAVTSNSILPKQELLYTEIERLMKSF